MEKLARENKNSTEKVLSFSELKKILFLSFMFSQGDPDLQNKILLFVRDYYGQQKKLNQRQNKVLDDYIGKVLVKLKKIGAHEVEVSSYGGGISTDNSTDYTESPSFFLESLTRDYLDIENFSQSIFDFLKQLMERDLYFYEVGRKNRFKSSGEKNNLRDPHISFFINYILRNTKAGEDSFDNLFKKSKGVLRDFFQTKDKNSEDLKTLISEYNKTHLDTKVTNEELEKLGIDIKI